MLSTNTVLDFVRSSCEQFENMTAEDVSNNVDLKLAKLLYHALCDFGFSTSTAAKVVGKIKISVADKHYNSDPALFERWVLAAARVLWMTRKNMEDSMGADSADVYMVEIASQMLITAD